VNLIYEASKILAEKGFGVRVVSFPSWELFSKQTKEYRESVFPSDVTNRLSVELGVSQGWEKWVGERGEILSIDHYGASAPYQVILEHFGFTVENIVNKALKMLSKEKK
jgi:transketolase